MLTDDDKLPFGKKKGTKLGKLSDGYLTGLYDGGGLSEDLKAYIENRVTMIRILKEKREREQGKGNDDGQ